MRPKNRLLKFWDLIVYTRKHLIILGFILLLIFSFIGNAFSVTSIPNWISINSVSTNQINLVWENVINETSYALYRSTNSNTNNAVFVINNSIDMTNYEDTELLGDTWYFYWIKAYSNADSQGFSLPASNVTFPAPVNWVSALVINTNQIDLVWNDLNTETMYTLFRSTNNNANDAMAILGTNANVTNYSDMALEPNKWYYYWLKAKNQSGVSIYSEISSNKTRISSSPQFNDLDNVYVGPNPCKPNPLTGLNSVTFVNLPQNAEIRIYNILGRLITILKEDDYDSTLDWTCINDNNEILASDIYICHISDTNGHVKVIKLLIIK